MQPDFIIHFPVLGSSVYSHLNLNIWKTSSKCYLGKVHPGWTIKVFFLSVQFRNSVTNSAWSSSLELRCAGCLRIPLSLRSETNNVHGQHPLHFSVRSSKTRNMPCSLSVRMFSVGHRARLNYTFVIKILFIEVLWREELHHFYLSLQLILV